MCGIFCLVRFFQNSSDWSDAIKALSLLEARGPDCTNYKVLKVNENVEIFMGFTRLAIMDQSSDGVQPFVNEHSNAVICNGEIYNFKNLIQDYNLDKTKIKCDCKVILPVFQKVGFKHMIRDELNAEFAMVLFDFVNKKLYAARDRYGVRPLFYGYNKKTNLIGFASELKVLHNFMDFIEQVKPNLIYTIDLNLEPGANQFDFDFSVRKSVYYSYHNLSANLALDADAINYIHDQLNYYLTEAVAKRLEADRPMGFLLSGGLDSSLIVTIASKILSPENIVCFSIGFENSPDVEAAKKVVQYLGIPNHHIINLDLNQSLQILPTVIKDIESYDVTTIRASVCQYLLAKYIKENTEIKVLFSGEGSDEVSGSYRYFRDAPNVSEFHWETIRLLADLCYFDNLRSDRTMASNGLEVRIPFLDFEYVEFITKINPKLKMYSKNNMEKQILRDSFKDYLPNDILYRSKEAFSDAVSSNEINWAKNIQEIAAQKYTNQDLDNSTYTFNKPLTLDALYFRDIFNNFYPNRCNVIPYYWLPKFQKESVIDPSARVLKSYK